MTQSCGDLKDSPPQLLRYLSIVSVSPKSGSQRPQPFKMRLLRYSLLSAFVCQIIVAQTILSNITTPSLNLTTLTGRNNASVLECWSIPGFAASSTAGTSGALNLFLGDTANASYTILPARFNGGVHRAPAPQYVLFTSGLAHVTLPDPSSPNMTNPQALSGVENEAWVQGGKYGLILALDTSDVSGTGHITTYPSASDSVTLQVPLSQAGYQQLLSEKRVLYDGPCKPSEMVGI